MNRHPWSRLGTLFSELADLDEASQEAQLRALQEDDRELAREVRELLSAADRAGSFLERPVSRVRRGDGEAAADSTLGPFRVVREVGRGGMGSVYLARHRPSAEPAAVKVVRRGLDTADVIARFEREREILAALAHRGITEFLQAGCTEDGRPWMAMEWVEGRPIDRHCDALRLRPRERLGLFLELLEAVGHAHRHGVVHRDLKPSNVLVTPTGEVKVLDFGIAKVLDPSGSGAATTLTRFSGRPLTPSYAAPEQVRGGATDPATDVYALGVMLYRLLAGRPPYDLERLPPATLARVVCEVPPPAPGVGENLDRIVLRALSKRAGDRYADASSFAEDLQRYRRGEGIEALDLVEWRARESVPSLAVLEFRRLSSGPDDWLGAGIAVTLRTDLKKLSGVRVLDRSEFTGARHHGPDQDRDTKTLRDLGRRLGISWIVGGALQTYQEDVRITASILDVRAGEFLDTVRVDGSLREIFALQDRVVEGLAAALSLQVEGASNALRTGRSRAPELEAYERFARATRLIEEMDSPSFERARRHLERAVEIDPRYALAHAGLGRLHAMRFIGTTDPGDLQAAVVSLQKAGELDPQLGDSWSWLAYCYVRQARFGEAVAAGRLAVDVAPQDPFGHYFLALACWTGGRDDSRELPSLWGAGLEHLGATNRLAPRFQPGHQVRGSLLLRLGRYEAAADALDRAAEIESSGEFQLARFVGAHSLIGRLHLREGRYPDAERAFWRSLQLLEGTQHVYTPLGKVAAWAGLGEVAALERRLDEAVSHYRHAVELALESPAALGVGWLHVRARIELAGLFHRLGMTRARDESFARAEEQLAERTGGDFGANLEDEEAEIRWRVARYHALLERPRGAMVELGRAVGAGWVDPHYFGHDPGLRSLRNYPGFRKLADQAAARAREATRRSDGRPPPRLARVVTAARRLAGRLLG